MEAIIEPIDRIELEKNLQKINLSEKRTMLIMKFIL